MSTSKNSRCENCIIRQFNAFKSLTRNELKEISDSKITKTIKRGEVLFAEGENLNGVFCVRQGVTKLSKTSENGKDQIIKIASKGSVLGHRSIIAHEKTNLSAQALGNMEVCYVPKMNIINAINNNPEFTRQALKLMAKDLRFADNALVNMAQKTVKQRVAETLQYLEKNYGVDSKGYISLVLKREDIANLVGTAKEPCIRTLTMLKNEGLISTDGKRIKIEDDNALYRIVEGFN